MLGVLSKRKGERSWVPLDKDEGVVKAQLRSAAFFFRVMDSSSVWKTEAVHLSRESFRRIAPPTIDSTQRRP